MFWYIGGILAGFAIGYVVAISKNRKRGGYKKGVNDCRKCKYLEYINEHGTVFCKKFISASGVPEVCAKYRCIEATEGDS